MFVLFCDNSFELLHHGIFMGSEGRDGSWQEAASDLELYICIIVCCHYARYDFSAIGKANFPHFSTELQIALEL
jgi:hypothetical protein